MGKAIKVCKVCGKEYEYCRTYLPTAFRWQDVACCREHGQEYFRMIEDARANEATVVNTEKKANTAIVDAEPQKSEPTRVRTKNRKKTKVTYDEGDRA